MQVGPACLAVWGYTGSILWLCGVPRFAGTSTFSIHNETNNSNSIVIVDVLQVIQVIVLITNVLRRGETFPEFSRQVSTQVCSHVY